MTDLARTIPAWHDFKWTELARVGRSGIRWLSSMTVDESATLFRLEKEKETAYVILRTRTEHSEDEHITRNRTEHCANWSEARGAWRHLLLTLGPLPLVDVPAEDQAEDQAVEDQDRSTSPGTGFECFRS